jgi:hypothetical protein
MKAEQAMIPIAIPARVWGSLARKPRTEGWEAITGPFSGPLGALIHLEICHTVHMGALPSAQRH